MMDNGDIDDILEGGAPHEVDPAVLSRVSASMMASMEPVRPLPPVWMIASWLLMMSLALSVAFASVLGLDGIRNLDGAEIGAIFPLLAILCWLTALQSAAQMTPGGTRWKNPLVMEPVMTNPAALLLVVCVCWLAIDALFFRDYQMGAFVPQGIPCLRAGLIVAIPAGIASWLLLRRGFAVNRTGAGLAAGTLAGIAGLVMLELHCRNFLAPHIMVWHTAVVPISALVGALVARITRGASA